MQKVFEESNFDVIENEFKTKFLEIKQNLYSRLTQDGEDIFKLREKLYEFKEYLATQY